MKLITAIIQLTKVDEVCEALVNKKITRITTSRVTGRGQQVDADLYRGQEVGLDLIPKARIDIACNDEFAETICDTIVEAARIGEGKLGDGKIFVTALEECIRIRTGEKGSKAI